MRFRDAGRLCALAPLLLRCGDDGGGSPPIDELSLVSFNAALGVGLAPYAPERLDAIERDLPSLAADVVCLQEVWLPEDLERLTTSLAASFPYSVRSVRPSGSLGAACSESEASLLSSCLADNCADVDSDGLPLCAIANCAEPFTQVSMGCQQCIAANQSASDVENLTTICAASDQGAAAFANQTGLLLLSRFELEDLGYSAFESSLGDRGLLSARLRTSFLGDVDLHCTHLAATLSEVPYTGAYGSWQGERLRQIDQMLERVSAVSASSTPILMGDMNCGPQTPLAESASPDAFARFTDAGFDDPYSELDGRCTFCGNNPLNGLVTDPEEGALIDHVLVPASARETGRAALRVFDEVLSIDVDAMPVETARSDHYGVRVQLSPGAAR